MSYQDVLQLMFPFLTLRASNKSRGTLINFLKNFKEKKIKNDRNALIDVKMNKNSDVKIF